MTFLSLLEAADLARTSKVDVWRAIRSGLLPSRKNSDGDYVVDPIELFRVFETQRPEPRPEEQEATPSPAPPIETAPPDELTVAFAALGSELRTLLAEGRDSGSRGAELDPGQ